MAARARSELAAELTYKTTLWSQLAWALMPLYTFGFLGFGPLGLAAVTLRDKRLWRGRAGQNPGHVSCTATTARDAHSMHAHPQP